MARAKRRFSVMFTNDNGSGCFGVFKSLKAAEEEMRSILRDDAYEISIGYKDLHMTCEIVESIVY